MNDLITHQTPIEIALEIDPDGKASAKRLYDFLGLDKSNYSKWAKRNIEENEFAEENVDFQAFVLNDEWGGQATKDYKLTASFAKKLAMGTHNERGEMARNYFIKVEERLKQIAVNASNLSPQLQIVAQMLNAMAQQELATKRAEQLAIQAKADANHANERIEAIKDTLVELPSDKWRKWLNSQFAAMNKGTGTGFDTLRNESYHILKERARTDISKKVKNAQDRLRADGATKTRINAYRPIDAIEADNRIREIYTSIVKEMVLKYTV